MAKASKPKCYIAANLSADAKDAKYGFLNKDCELTGEIEKADIIIYDLNHKPETWPLYAGLPSRNDEAEVIFTAMDDAPHDDEHLELIKLCFKEAHNYYPDVRCEQSGLINEIKRTVEMKRKVDQRANQQLVNRMASMTVQWQKGTSE
jgi:hypothetical protein